jgi:myo-inositol-1(or 4)-monophosphatase
MASPLETAVAIAQEAGALIANYAERRPAFEIKGEQDLVTEADRASEALIIDRLRSHFPSHGIVAEESGLHESSSDYRWYVDPLDGTTNFAHGFPAYNVTLALEKAGELVCGVVYDPTRNELFTAESGGGAYLNNRRMSVSASPRMEEALLSTGFPSRKRHENINVHFFYQLSIITHGIRRTGSAAIDLAYVASGRSDGFWEFGLNPWDMAAGVLMIREAGGRVTNMKGGSLSLAGPHLLATNGRIHDQVLAQFGDVFAGKWEHSLPQTSTHASSL